MDGFTDAELRSRYRFRKPQRLFVFRHPAFTASVISNHISFFSLVGHSLCEFALKNRKVFFNFFRYNGISEALKLCLRALREVAGKAAIVARWSL